MSTRTNNLVRTSIPGWCGLVALFASFFFLQEFDLPGYFKSVIIIGVLYSVLFVVEAVLCFRGDFGLISASPKRELNVGRILTKIVGWVLTILFVSSAYWLFPEYSGDFYWPYYQALRLSWPYLTIFFLVCILWDDTRADNAEDDYFQLGNAALKLNPRLLSGVNLKQHFLKWIIKIYFLPLMFVYMVNDVQFKASSTGAMYFYDTFYNAFFLIDTSFAVAGYLFGNTLIDTHTRSAEPTVAGWLFAILCYQPFWSLIGNEYLRYGGTWASWLADYPRLQIAWMILIFMFLWLYVWSTISFGSRFSNLTHRGILVCGPYAYLRHPAYIGKLGSYLLMYIPFAGGDLLTSIRNLILWTMLASIYYLRAKTEEAHLRSIGPEYDIYANEVAQNWKRLWSKLPRPA